MEAPIQKMSVCELYAAIRFFTSKNENAINIPHQLISVEKKEESFFLYNVCLYTARQT